MAEKTPAKRRGHEFTPEEIERSLLALALNGGNRVRAHKMLKLDNTLTRVPSERVLTNWKHQHADRYNELRDQHAPQIEANFVRDYGAIVARTNEVHLQAVERTAEGINDLDAKAAAAAAKNLAIAGGVAADKLLVFTDRPNIITSRPDPEQTLTGLMRALGIPQADVIQGTATEIPTDALLPESASTNARD